MKKNYLLIFLLLFMFRAASGQNCNFSYYSTPGSTLVDFVANQTFNNSLYHFNWNFGDNSAGTGATPFHTYNSAGPFVVCYTILDTGNHVVCSACDTVVIGNPSNCIISSVNTGSTFTFTGSGFATGVVAWDFGDGNTGSGNPATHTYANGGVYNVTMFISDSILHQVICQSTVPITIPGTGNCSFSSYSQGPVLTCIAANVSPNTLVSWDFGDGTVGAGYQVTHPYSVNGNYNVCMNATDLFGMSCQSCQVVSITVGSGNCYFNSSPDSLNPNSFSFNAVPAYPSSVIAWDFGDGTSGIGNSINHVFPIVGTYTVCMTELDSQGGILCTSCQAITIHSVPNCSFTYSVSFLNPLTINFQANGANNAVTWDFGDGLIDTGYSVSHTYAIGGIYNVCISSGIPGTPNFCNFCDIVSVGNATNYCNITFYPDPLSPNTFVFSSNQSSPTSVVMWDFGDNTVGIGQSVSHTYSTPGVYLVCITERDSQQNILCQNCVTVQSSGGGGGTVCQASFLATSYGLDAYFVDMSISGSPFVTYNWDFGDGSTSNLEFPQHTYASIGLYNVCLTISDSGCTDTFCSPLLVDTNALNPGNGCNAFYAFIQLAPYQVTVVNLSSGLNLTYDWDYGDGSPHDNTAYPSHFYTQTGTYNLCLTVSDANGCSSSYCDTLSVDSLGHIYRMASSGFTLNVLSPAQLTGVKEVETSKSFGVYPNPFNSEIRISMLTGSQKATDYRIFSVQGAEILRGKLEGTNGAISTQSLSSGVYMLEVTMNDGSRGFQRIIKN